MSETSQLPDGDGGMRFVAKLRRWFAIRRVVRVVSLVVLPFVLTDVGPAWAAHLRHGTAGQFVAVRQECSRYGCDWYGTFTSLDGRVTRDDVLLASGGDASFAGDVVAAQDTGDRAVVYPANGGWDWLLTSAFVALAVGVIIHWIIETAQGRRRST
jgi:hypothetical protein